MGAAATTTPGVTATSATRVTGVAAATVTAISGKALVTETTGKAALGIGITGKAAMVIGITGKAAVRANAAESPKCSSSMAPGNARRHACPGGGVRAGTIVTMAILSCGSP